MPAYFRMLRPNLNPQSPNCPIPNCQSAFSPPDIDIVSYSPALNPTSIFPNVEDEFSIINRYNLIGRKSLSSWRFAGST